MFGKTKDIKEVKQKSQRQKQANYEYIATNFDVWSEMVRQRSILGIRPVGLHLSQDDPNNFIG